MNPAKGTRHFGIPWAFRRLRASDLSHNRRKADGDSRARAADRQWLGASRAEVECFGRSAAEHLGPGRPEVPCRGPGGPAPPGTPPLGAGEL